MRKRPIIAPKLRNFGEMRPGAYEQMNRYGAAGVPFLFIIGFNREEAMVIPIEEAEREGILFTFHGITNRRNQAYTALGAFTFEKEPVPFELYRKAFDTVMAHITGGNSYLVNLTFATPIVTSLSLEEIFHRSNARYSLLVKDRFVVFSPERFIRIEQNRIHTYPMKGTLDAAFPDAMERLLNDPKELAEHYTIVDLMRNDLSMVAKNVRVDRFRFAEVIRTHRGGIIQTSSEITGEVGSDWRSRIGDILFPLLPAGSISGAPKQRTLEIIREAETDSRGFFTGICGLFDGEILDSGVMIRFIEKSPGKLLYRSGGGITSFSDPVSEYREMVEKVYVPFV